MINVCVELCLQNEMLVLGVMDLNNFFGVLEVFIKFFFVGVQLIIGCMFFIDLGQLSLDRIQGCKGVCGDEYVYCLLVLLSKIWMGFENLMQFLSEVYVKVKVSGVFYVMFMDLC